VRLLRISEIWRFLFSVEGRFMLVTDHGSVASLMEF
jgi:hypothetical protein